MLIDNRDTDRDIVTHIDRSQVYKQRYRHTDNYIDRLQWYRQGYRNTNSYIDR